tara:strand:+ start:564 stop:869 length:306 start_codon:yes stop_codon:yes gene_type:complete
MEEEVDQMGDIVGKICSFIPEAGKPRLAGKIVKKGKTEYDKGYNVPDCTLVVEGRSLRRIELSSYICSFVYLFDSWKAVDTFNKNGWLITDPKIKIKSRRK